ncbi:MAG: hypothetical protein ACJAWQ_002260 [Paraglaciecola sp.]|jgi:hypothetical protein
MTPTKNFHPIFAHIVSGNVADLAIVYIDDSALQLDGLNSLNGLDSLNGLESLNGLNSATAFLYTFLPFEKLMLIKSGFIALLVAYRADQ